MRNLKILGDRTAIFSGGKFLGGRLLYIFRKAKRQIFDLIIRSSGFLLQKWV